MTQPEQSEQNMAEHPSGPPKAIGVYDRPKSKKSPINIIVAVVFIILLSLLSFWLMPMLF